MPASAAPAPDRVVQLGDARSGKLAANLGAFCRMLRRAGVPVDAARMALAQQALQWVGLAQREDASAALEAVLIAREQDRAVFRELFDAFFRDPKLANKLLAQMLPRADGHAKGPKRRPRVAEALSPPKTPAPAQKEDAIDLDAAMTASQTARLKTADFNQLSASEYRLVERLVRDIPLPLPTVSARRTRGGMRGARIHWRRTFGAAAQCGGDIMALHRLQRRRQPLPLLVLVDVSGSMERYARLLLAFLHCATARTQVGSRGLAVRRDVFAFGSHLTDLNAAFRLSDTDAMLLAAGQAIDDFAGGTRLGASLAELRRHHWRRLVGRRTLVLLVSDGLDTGEPAELAGELAWLKRHTRSLLWLNPLLRFGGYEPIARGAAELHRAADGMLAVHNVTRLHELADAIARLLQHH
ncbi:VWA domain-containing protein [Comamonas sp. NLF-1-9]|uniref:vWA domain-containing protein n=1 Tax=Comamonas sp. NLF-1-9 TaxID=2853163 RepID=UPI001C4394B4|nr:VWA domain-containing protein [Comamonas sp. NLF-1-9]QXL83807.1 VWA domain-containing protein [Comamonas sp. NLF-1-9]